MARRRVLHNDPLFADLNIPPHTEDVNLGNKIRERWESIKTYLRTQTIVTTLNVRLWNGDEAGGIDRNMLWDKLNGAFDLIDRAAKINYAFGAILQHKIDGSLRYYHTSPNHNAELPGPVLVRDVQTLQNLFDRVEHDDFTERAARKRPNTQWTVKAVTNVSFFIYRVDNAGRI